ncbi:hypothetical protein D5018_16985 [Parashewanella curva]|uniref:Uncharacterized protein n=1 Tax=Parashewanella curva TaxID=2338552 RepID=A0A3L8PSW4_9GAMM|nr:hypothetical protein [Parashewanella curva]RLV58510.1 hypothetical protein D5018_16985 [Parashewanella curva]
MASRADFYSNYPYTSAGYSQPLGPQNLAHCPHSTMGYAYAPSQFQQHVPAPTPHFFYGNTSPNNCYEAQFTPLPIATNDSSTLPEASKPTCSHRVTISKESIVIDSISSALKEHSMQINGKTLSKFVEKLGLDSQAQLRELQATAQAKKLVNCPAEKRHDVIVHAMRLWQESSTLTLDNLISALNELPSSIFKEQKISLLPFVVHPDTVALEQATHNFQQEKAQLNTQIENLGFQNSQLQIQLVRLQEELDQQQKLKPTLATHSTTAQLQDTSTQTSNVRATPESNTYAWQALSDSYDQVKTELATRTTANCQLEKRLAVKDEQIAELEQELQSLSVNKAGTNIQASQNRGNISITVNNTTATTTLPPTKPAIPITLTEFEEKLFASKPKVDHLVTLMQLYRDSWRNIGEYMPSVFPTQLDRIEEKLSRPNSRYTFSDAMTEMVSLWVDRMFEKRSYFDFFYIVSEATETDLTSVTNKLVEHMRRKGLVKLASYSWHLRK